MCGAGPRVRQMATQNKWWLKERLSNEQEKVIKYIAIVETVGTVPFCVITNLKSRSFHIIILFPYWWLSCNKLFSLSVNKHWGLAGREKKWFVVSGIGDHYWSSYWFSNKQHYLFFFYPSGIDFCTSLIFEKSNSLHSSKECSAQYHPQGGWCRHPTPSNKIRQINQNSTSVFDWRVWWCPRLGDFFF